MSSIAPRHDGTAPEEAFSLPPAPIRLDVVSDLICPWCYIAKARLARAVDALTSDGIEVSVTWRAYELNPDMPPAGMDRKVYRTRKFGSWEHSRAMDEHVAREGEADGLSFAYDRVSRTPNTRLAHRLAHRALRDGGPALQDRIVGGLFESYFAIGEDIGDRDTLVAIARAGGVSDTGLDDYLRSSEDEDAIRREETIAAAAGLRGVPAVLCGDVVLFSGARSADDIVRTLRSVHGARVASSEPGRSTSGGRAAPIADIGASIFEGAS